MIGNADTTAARPSFATKSRDEQLAALLDEYLASIERGEPACLDEIIDQHPTLADDLRRLGEAVEHLHGATTHPRAQGRASLDKTSVAARRLGDFELGAEIGRGGMGVVYEARQISLQRKVALKVLPFAAMWDQKQVARFRNEAQAAAQLHHPNIVPVFAVGNERGVHYFAMQLIEGQSLDEMLSELRAAAKTIPAKGLHVGSTVRKLSATKPATPTFENRLSRQFATDREAYWRAVSEIGVQAGEALHEAHEYGVIHRDVKPSNLLLDSSGKLWVTDFGLARVQHGPGVTMTGDVVGTLRYMSPEQAAGRRALTDCRTDVYALGATLYELLTLRPAFPGDDQAAIRRALEETEPTAPREIVPSIPVDLETIVLKAMAKRPQDRYLTADALAEDLRRFLKGKSLLARRPTLFDRASKWLRRRRKLAAVVAIAVTLLAVVSTTAAGLLVRERAAKDAALSTAQQNLERAEEHFRQARQVVDRFGIQFAGELEKRPGMQQLRRRLLIEAKEYYEAFAKQIGDSDDLRRQLATTLLKTGVVSAKLGAREEAVENYRAAQQFLRELIAEAPNEVELRADLALSRNNVALLMAELGDAGKALQQYQLAIDVQRSLVKSEPESAVFAEQLAKSYVNIGVLQDQLGRAKLSAQNLQRAVDVFQRTQQSADDPSVAHNLAVALNNLASVERQFDLTSAETSARRAQEILQAICRSPKAPDQYRADLALCHANLASLLGNDGRIDEAIDSCRQAVILYESLVRRSPEVVSRRSELAATLNNLALLHLRQDDLEAAADAFGYANRLYVRLLFDFPNYVPYYSGWAALLNNQAHALDQLGRHEEAIQAYEQATAALDAVVERTTDARSLAETRNRIYYNYSQALLASEQWEEAFETALKRRDLWNGNGQRLFESAVELSIITNYQSAVGENTNRLVEEVIDTLHAAVDSGYLPEAALVNDSRFAALPGHECFSELQAKWQRTMSAEDRSARRRHQR